MMYHAKKKAVSKAAEAIAIALTSFVILSGVFITLTA